MHPQPNVTVKEVFLENGHRAVVFIITEGWAWDLTDLRWVRLSEVPAKGL